jgi:NADPH-dependent curcumin reductase CurA
LAARPGQEATLAHFRREEVPIGALQDGQLLVRTVYLSVDPHHRTRLDSPADRFGLSATYRAAQAPPAPIGETLRGAGVGQVLESRDARFAAGDIVEGDLGYQTHCVARGAGDGTPTVVPLRTELTAAGADPVVQKFDPGDAPLHTRLNALGEQGLTAHIGLIEVGRPRPGETVFVSSAAGSVGQVAGQVAKIMGCRAVGSAGSDDKVQYCVEELGFDAAINYKDPAAAEQLDAVCPGGIDVYFDLVGGAFSDLIFSRLNERGRHVACGSIADFWADPSRPEHRGPRLYRSANTKRIRIEGFWLPDYDHLYEPYIRQLRRWWSAGMLRSREHVLEGIDAAPQALLDIFAGRNLGKALVRVGTDPFAG